MTLIEEAHRLLRAPRGGGMETGDAQAKAVTMFTDMLAEMRAYGEAFIVADQIRVKLAPEVLKNSNVKIIHRLSAPDDRAAVAASINLTDGQSRHLVTLQPGTAVVHDDVIGSAVLARIAELAPPAPGAHSSGSAMDRWYLQRDGGCTRCPRPCTFGESTLLVREEDAIDDSLEAVFQALLLGDAAGAQDAFGTWRQQWREKAVEVPANEESGTVYCAVTQSANRWLRRTLEARAVEVDPVTGDERAAAGLAGSLLAQDRAARQIGQLVAAWLVLPTAISAPAGAPRSSDPVESTILRLHELIAASPPHEMAGCASCPARCRMLPMAMTFLAGPGRGTVQRVNAPTPPGTRLRAVKDLLREDPALDRLPPSHRQALLHCVVTNAGNAARADVTDLLAEIAADSGTQP